MAANTADISGISASSSGAWSPDTTSTPRLKPVTMMMAASAAKVARIPQSRHPYTRNRPIQIKWNGTVAHSRNIRIPATLASTKIHQPISTRYRRHRREIRSAKVNPVADAADGGDHVRVQLRPQPPDVDVDHIRLRVEAVAPDRGQEALLGNRAARMLHQLRQQHRLPPCQSHGPGPGVRLLADRVEYDLGGGENMRVGQAPVPDPGQQLIQHERLGQVVVGAHFEAGHLRRGVGQAGEHDDWLGWPEPHQPAQDGHAVGAWHQQVEDDDAIGTRECQPQALLAVGGGVDLQSLATQGPGEEAEHPRLVVYRKNSVAHLRILEWLKLTITITTLYVLHRSCWKNVAVDGTGWPGTANTCGARPPPVAVPPPPGTRALPGQPGDPREPSRRDARGALMTGRGWEPGECLVGGTAPSSGDAGAPESSPRGVRHPVIARPAWKIAPMKQSSKWSLWSQDSFLSIGSRGSVLSIGSVGSFLSVGSVGSFASAFSIGSSMSMLSLLSALSAGSVMSFRSVRGVMSSSRRPEDRVA